MSISNQAKRRAAELHNLRHEAKLNQHYAHPLFNYLMKLCYPIEMVRQEAASTRGESRRVVLAAALLASTTSTIRIRNRRGV